MSMVRMNAGMCVTRAWTLNFLWILNKSGSDEAKEDKKFSVQCLCLWRPRFLVVFKGWTDFLQNYQQHSTIHNVFSSKVVKSDPSTIILLCLSNSGLDGPGFETTVPVQEICQLLVTVMLQWMLQNTMYRSLTQLLIFLRRKVF